MLLFQLQSLYRGKRDVKVIMNFNLGKYLEGQFLHTTKHRMPYEDKFDHPEMDANIILHWELLESNYLQY